MEKFTVHTGTAVPLRRSNVDTDQIIPAVYLKRVTRSGFEDGLFRSWRDADPGFVLNDPRLAVTGDLGQREGRTAGSTWSFPLDDFSRWRLLEGLDDIGLTQRHDELIGEYESRRPAFKPVVA